MAGLVQQGGANLLLDLLARARHPLDVALIEEDALQMRRVESGSQVGRARAMARTGPELWCLHRNVLRNGLAGSPPGFIQ